MPKKHLHRLQYSLSALLALVTIAGFVCAFAGLFGYATLFAIAPVAFVFWVMYRIIDKMITGDNRNSNLKGPEPPFSTPP